MIFLFIKKKLLYFAPVFAFRQAAVQELVFYRVNLEFGIIAMIFKNIMYPSQIGGGFCQVAAVQHSKSESI